MSVTAGSAVERVLAGLTRERDRCVRQVVSDSIAIDGYAALDPEQLTDFADTVREGFDAIVRASSEQRAFGEDDVAFLWPHIRRRTTAGVPAGDMLAVIRIFQRVLWDAIVALAGDDEAGRAAALILARPLLEYVDVLSNTVNRACSEAGEALASRAGRIRADLVETLLAGSPPGPGPMLNAARAAELGEDSALLVIVARPLDPALDHTALRVAALGLARVAGGAIEPLAVVRGDEIVVLQPCEEDDAPRIADGLAEAQRQLSDRGIGLAVGASTVHDGLAEIPSAYTEACMALEQVRDTGGTLALHALSVVDYMVLRAGDRTAWRLVPAPVREFVEEDVRVGGVLSDTLLAYVACDLSVKLASERLFVHPNTSHYRLAKIEARTGCDMRRFDHVELLALAIRLQRGGR